MLSMRDGSRALQAPEGRVTAFVVVLALVVIWFMIPIKYDPAIWLKERFQDEDWPF
jgi:hypothetical protein